MANFKTPYTFIAGTKAKAEEVNENFDAIKDELNKKLDKNEDGTIVVKEATSDNQAINKKQLDDTVEKLDEKFSKITSTIEYKKSFLVDKGNMTTGGRVDLLNVEDNTKVVFKVDEGESYKPLKCTRADSSQFTRTSIPELQITTFADGTYNLFVSDTGNCEAISSKIYKQKTMPQKVIESAWTQPKLTSAGTIGGTSFACAVSTQFSGYEAFRALDGTKTGGNGDSAWCSTGLPAYFTFYNPNPIKVTGLEIWNRTYGNICAIKGGEIQASNDNQTWVTLTTFTNTVTAHNASWTIDLSDNTQGYKYYKIYITSSTDYYGKYQPGMGELAITANEYIDGCKANDIWLDTSDRPYKAYKFDGLNWDTEFDYVPLPQNISISNGEIVSADVISAYGINGYDEYLNLPDYTQPTSLTNGANFTAPLDGWICTSTTAKPIYRNEVFVPTTTGYVYYPNKGVS